MNIYIFEDKTEEETKKKALNDLNVIEENLIILKKNTKNGIIKKSFSIEVTTMDEVINYIKEELNEILNLMNIKANLEIRKRENKIEIKMFSNNNSILIGKNGKTLESIQILLRQIVKNKINIPYLIIIDVENYKEKRNKNIEYLAKKLAKEVANTQIETSMDNMNSYERRLVHNVLSNNKYVYTVSEGEEPNRHVVIKPREE